MYYKVKEEGRTQTRCVYNIIEINNDGRKDVLGMYVSQSEGANFWLGVITDLKQRRLLIHFRTSLLTLCNQSITSLSSIEIRMMSKKAVNKNDRRFLQQ